MSSLPRAGAVIFAKDMARVARFYQELLAMGVTHSGRDHIALESAACQLVIHAIPKKIAAAIEIASPPALRTERSIKPFFFVASLADIREKAPALGGGLNPRKNEFEARGFRACDGHDPEGNVIQFREDAS
jgi:predicted enzyme related to lactoylglutathione lyase